MSKVIVIVGAKKTGKTTKAIEIMKAAKKPYFIQDINLQYLNFVNKATPMDIKDFFNKAKDLTGHCVVFDEATLYFEQQGITRDAKTMLTSSRHTKNLFILNFHSLRLVPLDVIDLCNYLIIGKTNDIPAMVEKKFKNFRGIYENYLSVQADKDFHAKRFLVIQD